MRIKNPIVVYNNTGKLHKLHAPEPGEKCNLDDSDREQTIPWEEAFELIAEAISKEGEAKGVLCQNCYGVSDD